MHKTLKLLVLAPLFFGVFFSQKVAADIGLINSSIPTTSVLYEENDKVFLRVCTPPQYPPLTRHCAGDTKPYSIPLKKYLSSLYFVQGYPISEAGLDLAEKAKLAAEKAGDKYTVKHLEGICTNLKENLAIVKALKETEKITTYYEFHYKYKVLLNETPRFEGKVYCHISCDKKMGHYCRRNYDPTVWPPTPRGDAYTTLSGYYSNSQVPELRAREICDGSSETFKVGFDHHCSNERDSTFLYFTYSNPKVDCD